MIWHAFGNVQFIIIATSFIISLMCTVFRGGCRQHLLKRTYCNIVLHFDFVLHIYRKLLHAFVKLVYPEHGIGINEDAVVICAEVLLRDYLAVRVGFHLMVVAHTAILIH